MRCWAWLAGPADPSPDLGSLFPAPRAGPAPRACLQAFSLAVPSSTMLFPVGLLGRVLPAESSMVPSEESLALSSQAERGPWEVGGLGGGSPARGLTWPCRERGPLQGACCPQGLCLSCPNTHSLTSSLAPRPGQADCAPSALGPLGPLGVLGACPAQWGARQVHMFRTGTCSRQEGGRSSGAAWRLSWQRLYTRSRQTPAPSQIRPPLASVIKFYWKPATRLHAVGSFRS